MPVKHTKIVATISDIRCDVSFLKQVFDEGVNVVRMNSAHMNCESFDRIIKNVREVSKEVAILLDTKGPEIRTTKIDGDEKIILKVGETVKIKGAADQLSTRECICVRYEAFVSDLNIGNRILFDDGEIEIKVIEKNADHLVCEVMNDGKLGSRKTVNVPGVRVNLPSLSETDIININHCIDKGIDFIAHSFVRNAQDVIAIQKMLDAKNSDIKIISKIENQEGVDNIDEILEHTYGVMIARGDLGVEVPQEKIPGIQRVLIRKCVLAHKPVIVATQMLHTMIENPRPTRAEITDIANAIFYRTDAVMLSGETAYGKYPVESVRTMANIAREAELTKLTENDIRISYEDNEIDTTSLLAKAAVSANEKIGAKLTITHSTTGRTARTLAAYRGRKPVYAICDKEETARRLALSYGIFPMIYQEKMGKVKLDSKDAARDYLRYALNELKEKGEVTDEDIVSYLGGRNGVLGGSTTYLEINKVSEV